MPSPKKYMDGEFITSNVSSETIAGLIAALITARSLRPLTPNEEALANDTFKEMCVRIGETAGKRGPVPPPTLVPRPTEAVTQSMEVVIPKGWKRVPPGTSPLRMADKIWDGKKFRYLSNNDVNAGPAKAEDFIIREIVGSQPS